MTDAGAREPHRYAPQDTKSWLVRPLIVTIVGGVLVALIAGVLGLYPGGHGFGGAEATPPAASTLVGSATTGATAAAILSPNDTPTPTPPPPTVSPIPTAGPAEPGTVLFTADWSGGLGGWFGSSDWTTIDGRLVSDGSHQEYGSIVPSIEAPITVSQRDYAVEVEIRLIRWTDEGGFTGKGSFGIAARVGSDGGYAAGLCAAAGLLACPDGINGFVMVAAEERERAPLAVREHVADREWHTFRLEVDGTDLRLVVDGATVLRAVDQRYLQPGSVGLWANGAQIEVRSLVVVAL